MKSIQNKSETVTNSWLTCITGIPVKAEDKPPKSSKKILRYKFNKQEKENIFKLIEKAMSQGINTTDEVWAHFELMEEETGEKVFLRNKDGQLMSWHTLNDYVMKIKKDKNPPVKLKSTMIVELYKQGKTESEIRGIVKCCKKQVYRSLVIAGLKKSKAKWYLDRLKRKGDT